MQFNILLGQLPEDTRLALMERFRGYFNKNPAVEKLSDVNRVMKDMFTSPHIEEAHLGENRV